MRREAKLLIHEPPLQVLPTLAKEIGLNEAIVLQQLHYWLNNPKVGADRGGFRWVFNTYEEWSENFPFWSVSTIRRIFQSLEGAGLVIGEQLDKKDWDMRKYYRIDYERLDALNLDRCEPPKRPDDNGSTETTEPKTTTEKEIGADAPKPDILDGEVRFHLKPLSLQEAIAAHFKLTPNWTTKTNRMWIQWAIEVGMTPELIERAALRFKSDKRFNWTAATLKTLQDHWLELIDDAPASFPLNDVAARWLARKEAA